MKTVLSVCLFLSCFIISSLARPQSIFDDIFVPINNQQQNQQQDNPFLPQRPQRPGGERPGDRPTNPFFPTNAATPSPAPTVTSSTARTPTTASPQYLACLASCASTNEYNPVCGSDRINYHNNARLECAKFCGKNVSAVRMGTCNAL